MPFRSKAQIRLFAVLVAKGKMKPETMRKWLIETKNISKLPERVKKRGKRKVDSARN